MRAVAFCPSHITGFFKAEIGGCVLESGSLGAGFSIRHGVTTTVTAVPTPDFTFDIKVSGYRPVDTRVSECVIREIYKRCGSGFHALVHHEIGVPVGYGLGCSGSAALSLAMALNVVLGLNLPREEVGKIAHAAEVCCRTGLGDVSASYYGGFEIRTKAGAPGVGALTKMELDSRAVIICFSPISTRQFISERLEAINGLGGRMVRRLAERLDYSSFQEMSVEFARYINVMTPRMEAVVEDLRRAGIGCGVALFGETIFALVSPKEEKGALEVFRRYGDKTIIISSVDNTGARLVR